MSERHDALLEAFVRSDASPDGKWWVDVPVGLSVGRPEGHAVLDAVCLVDRDRELPEVYSDHTGVPYVAHEGDEAVGVTRADKFRALRETDTFAGESAVLVAVEPDASSVGTVGDLLAYRELVRADWDWTVEGLLLVSDEDNEHVNHVCRELDVRAIRVA